jgi:hypothetical protein
MSEQAKEGMGSKYPHKLSRVQMSSEGLRKERDPGSKGLSGKEERKSAPACATLIIYLTRKDIYEK